MSETKARAGVIDYLRRQRMPYLDEFEIVAFQEWDSGENGAYLLYLDDYHEVADIRWYPGFRLIITATDGLSSKRETLQLHFHGGYELLQALLPLLREVEKQYAVGKVLG